MNPEEYRQLKAYTRQDGLIMGVIWVASFACFAYMFSYPQLSFLFNLLLLSIPFMMWHMVRRYRDNVICMEISFGRGFLYAFSICMYATLVLCACQWAYFQYLDHGALLDNIGKMLSMKEYEAMIKAYGIKDEEITMFMDSMREARPIDIAISFVSQSFIGSMICSAIIAFICKGKNKIQSKD